MADRRTRAFVMPLALVATALMLRPWSIAAGQVERIATAPHDHTREMQRVTLNVDNAPLVTVLHSIAQQAGLIPAFNRAVLPSTMKVTLHVRQITVSDAFQRALQGTGLVANVHEAGDVVIVRGAGTAVSASGGIAGRVTVATSKQPVRGAKIGLDGADRVTETTEDGTYRIVNVSPGPHMVTVKLLGYAKVTRDVNVQDNVITTADVALDASAAPLSQVVVTGTIIPTELKAVPNAITVITAKDIEQRGITKIDQLFRGDVPGLFAVSQGSSPSNGFDGVAMFSRGATALTYASSGATYIGSSNITNPIKTYVDGVEMADPSYLSQIDPKSIERIEILTGPQASTIYGSNAINGVMQVFTKRGTTSHPQLIFQFLNGWVENNFSSALTPQHDYSAQLTGVEGRMSYNAGGSWNYMGPWTPAYQHARTDGFGGIRLELPLPTGRVTADLTVRRALTQNVQRGDNSQAYTGYVETGWFTNSGAVGLGSPYNDLTSQLTGQTLGLTLGYALTPWWSQELILGQDVEDRSSMLTAKGFTSPSDTTLYVYNASTDRRSIRYGTTVRAPLTALANATLTAGADEWHTMSYSWYAYPPTTLIGFLNQSVLYRTPDHNTGAFVQAQLGVHEQLFFTYGVRAEFNPAVGDKAKVLPGRYGVAYTQELGAVTAKVRGSYGRSIRPPQAMYKLGRQYVSAGSSDAFFPAFGAFYLQLPNPELMPEYQQGGEGGLELYLGTRGSLVVTRYNQTVNGLIDLVSAADSVRSLAPYPDVSTPGNCQFQTPPGKTYGCSSIDANGYVYELQSEYLNIGSIRNQGWELQGSANAGPFTTKGTYSWTKSRVIGVTPKYRALFPANNYPQYRPGAPFQYLPEHTWAMGLTYNTTMNAAGFTLNGQGRTTTDRNAFYPQNLAPAIRLPQNRLRVSGNAGYVNTSPGYALASFTASRRISTRLEGTLQVDNLLDHYQNDVSAYYATMGRQSNVGLRLRW